MIFTISPSGSNTGILPLSVVFFVVVYVPLSAVGELL